MGFGYGDIENIPEPARPDEEGIFLNSLSVGSKSLPSPIPSREISHIKSGFGSPLPFGLQALQPRRASARRPPRHRPQVWLR